MRSDKPMSFADALLNSQPPSESSSFDNKSAACCQKSIFSKCNMGRMHGEANKLYVLTRIHSLPHRKLCNTCMGVSLDLVRTFSYEINMLEFKNLTLFIICQVIGIPAQYLGKQNEESGKTAISMGTKNVSLPIHISWIYIKPSNASQSYKHNKQDIIDASQTKQVNPR